MGSGGGFPGIPLAILLPENEFTLVDATDKKIRFLEDVSLSLDLKNVKTAHARVEDWCADSNFNAKFDIIFSRAMAEMDLLVELSYPLLIQGGRYIFFQSSQNPHRQLILEETLAKIGDYSLILHKPTLKWQISLGNRVLFEISLVAKKNWQKKSFASMLKESKFRHNLAKNPESKKKTNRKI